MGVIDGCILALLVNILVSITINTLYIITIQQSLSPSENFGVQIFLATFRLLYSSFVIPFLSKVQTDLVKKIRFKGLLQLTSNLIIPCVATLFASPSCFQVRGVWSHHHCGLIHV